MKKKSLGVLAEEYLVKQPDGATLREVRAALEKRTSREIPPHSLRAAMYRHQTAAGVPAFERIGWGRYRVRST
jgi:hypothetical protein